MATFVLVHGSWHGGWCWRKVATHLRAAGHAVFTPTLTGMGERIHLLTRDTGLSTYVRDVSAVMEYEDLNDVILVGHSYGGMVITGVAGEAPRRISRLVFLDAFTPADGESVFSQDKGGDAWRDGWTRLATAKGQGWLIPPGTAANMGVTDPDDAAWVEARLCSIPMASYDEPVHVADPAALHIPRSFILCSAMNWFAAYAERANAAGWDYHELDTGHDAMVTEPDKLAELLVACAQA